MTRKERLDLLKQIEKDIHVCSLESTLLDDAKSCAIHSVIEELEQAPCEDAISRQAAMDCFKKWQPYMATRLHEFEKELSALPPVNPQPKTGKWMETDSADPYWYMCSECHRRVDDKESYCPSCGAIMQESERV